MQWTQVIVTFVDRSAVCKSKMIRVKYEVFQKRKELWFSRHLHARMAYELVYVRNLITAMHMANVYVLFESVICIQLG